MIFKIVVIILGVLIILCIIAILSKQASEISKMEHLETQEIINDIFVIKAGSANFYLIKNGDEYIAIDAGGNKKEAQRELKKLQIPSEKVTVVLLTHTDFDHIAALGLFGNAAIYISKEEVQMIDGTVSRMLFVKSKLNYSYKTLEDNEERNFGKIKVKTILMPGHTKGSASFLIDDKYLFSGDNFSLKNGRIELFNSFFNMNDNIQKESIKRLDEIKDIEYIFTAHYGSIGEEQIMLFNKRFPFVESKNVATITCKHIMNDHFPILYVSHDENDGMWQFLCGNEHGNDEAMVVALEEVYEVDSSISEIADLPLGYVAFRQNHESAWTIESRK